MIARTRVKTIGRCLPPESGNFCTLFYNYAVKWLTRSKSECRSTVISASGSDMVPDCKKIDITSSG
jgi:hypothetical protein